MSVDWTEELARLGVAQAPELAMHRALLDQWLARLIRHEGIASIGLYGSLATGAASEHSDTDLVVEAKPGQWAQLWRGHAALLEPVGAAPDLRLEHQWGPVTDSVCCAGVSASGIYLDLVIRRHGGSPRVGERTIWRAERSTDARDLSPAAPTAAQPDPPPVIDADPIDDQLAMFWFGALLSARLIARGAVWAALEFVNGQRDSFLRLWRLVHAPGRADYGWTARVDAELPLDVRRRLASAVPKLDRRELASALWETVALFEDFAPGLAASSKRPYPHAGASFVHATMATILAAARLPAAAPSQTVPAVGQEAVVSLREITAQTVRAVCLLDTAPDQRHVVAPNARSLAQALFTGERAWYRAIYADETLVGFIMLYDNPAEAEYFLWRLMIDAQYQHLGYGRRAVELLTEYVRTRPGARWLGVSYHKGPGSPAEFYGKLGFVETGEIDEDEHIARLVLTPGEGD